MKREMLNQSQEMRKRTVRIMTVGMAWVLLSFLLLVPSEASSQVLLDEDNYGSARAAGVAPTTEFVLVPYEGGDFDQTNPIGDGWLLLGGLGVAYCLLKRRKAARKA